MPYAYKRKCEKCKATANEEIRLFKFPSNDEVRSARVRFVNDDFVPKSYSTLCSKHFNENDVIKSNVRVKLRPGALPQTGTTLLELLLQYLSNRKTHFAEIPIL